MLISKVLLTRILAKLVNLVITTMLKVLFNAKLPLLVPMSLKTSLPILVARRELSLTRLELQAKLNARSVKLVIIMTRKVLLYARLLLLAFMSPLTAQALLSALRELSLIDLVTLT
jgi:hypothetical protein